MTQHRLRTVGGACLLTMLSVLAAPVAPATGQGPPPGGTLPERIYSKSPTFDLPVLMKENTQQTLREVCLWVKAPGGTWTKDNSGPPSTQKFSFKASADGEYWFNLVTVDLQGKASPADVSLATPGLRVVVDTRPPVIEVQATSSSDGDATLRCSIQDANPNPASLRAVVRAAAGDVILESLPGQPGVFRVLRELMSNAIRITASDLAGNLAVRDVNIRELLPAAPTTAAAPLPVGPVVPPANPATPKSVTVETAPPSMVTQVGAIEKVPAAPPAAPATPPSAPALSTTTPSTPSAPSTPPAPAHSAPTSPAPAPLPTESLTKAPMLPSDTASTAGKGPANRRIINTRHASIDYRIDQIGTSGVGKVEVFVTDDQGGKWLRVGEDSDRQSPAEVDLPGEGLFGIRLAITNGNGFGGTPPAKGDAAHFWVEVDTTPPYVQLRPAEIVPNGGGIDIRWTATDANLTPEPVTLYYRTRPDGTWQPIGRSMKNEGSHRWAFPRDAGSQFYFKIEVVDLAGNTGRAEAQSPLTVDITEPRASVIGVSGTSKGN
jgi:hypothetical protein